MDFSDVEESDRVNDPEQGLLPRGRLGLGDGDPGVNR